MRRILIGVFILLLIGMVVWTHPALPTNQARTILDRNGTVLYRSHLDHGFHSWIAYDAIPQDIIKMTLLAEDKRFWWHLGVDPLAIVRALRENIAQNRISQGGSTIHQQVARYQIIKPYSPGSHTLLRKIRESLIALRLNLAYSKKHILETYLNTVYFGSNVYGIDTAAYRHFGTSVESLSQAEAALLIAMIANPSRFNPIAFPDNAKGRRDAILTSYYRSNHLNQELLERSLNEPLPAKTHQIPLHAPHAIDLINQEVNRLVPRSTMPLTIHTTLDLPWYTFARDVAMRQVASLGEAHRFQNAALVVVDNQTAAVVALVGNLDYFDSNHGGQINLATSPRQPGSALKPFIYAAAIDTGIITAATPLDDQPKAYLTKKGTGFIPNNYDGLYRGIILAREALASSYNLPAVEVLDRVGIPAAMSYLHQFGFSSLTKTDEYDLALTLGGSEVSLMELTAAYAALANHGWWQPVYLIDKITSPNGNIIYSHPDPKPVAAVTTKTASIITDILSDPKARYPTFGSRSPLSTSFNAAVKTGTTTDWHDNWTVGYTPEYTVGAWIGNADRSPMHNISGVTGAAPMWQALINQLCREFGCSSFTLDPELVEQNVCAQDGTLAGAACDKIYREWFIPGFEPEVSAASQDMTLAMPEIIFPKPGATFASNPFHRSGILFTTSRSNQVQSITWYLNGQTVANPWQPKVGTYTLDAHAILVDGKQFDLTPVTFRVTE
jgi:penicillin-binding protein 1C